MSKVRELGEIVDRSPIQNASTVGMGRKTRYMPPEYEVHEASTRTIQGRYLLRPGPEVNEIVRGILARAHRMYEIDLFATTFLSNHYHLLLGSATVEETADFMAYLNGNIARKVGKLHGWSGSFWQRRFDIQPVENTEEDQVRRLRYVLAQGCKENLVWKPEDWPGVHSVRELVTGEPISGIWVNQSEKYRSELRGEDRPLSHFQVRERCHLRHLPCWAHLPPDEYRQRIRDMIEEIERETVERHAQENTVPAGQTFVLTRDPEQRPSSVKESIAPWIHARSKKAQARYRQAYAWFLSAYREASRRFREGDFLVEFPPGCFPPRAPLSPLARAPS